MNESICCPPKEGFTPAKNIERIVDRITEVLNKTEVLLSLSYEVSNRIVGVAARADDAGDRPQPTALVEKAEILIDGIFVCLGEVEENLRRI